MSGRAVTVHKVGLSKAPQSSLYRVFNGVLHHGVVFEHFRRNDVAVGLVLELGGKIFDACGITEAEVETGCARMNHRGIQVGIVAYVGYGIAVESPFVLKYAGEHAVRAGNFDGAYFGEGCHEAYHALAVVFDRFDGHLICAEFNFPCALFGEERSNAIAVGFLIVEHEVFSGCYQAVFARAYDEFESAGAGEHGIFGIVFAVTSVIRVTVRVEAGAPEDGQTHEQRFVADEFAYLFHQIDVERGSNEGCAAEYLTVPAGVFAFENGPGSIGILGAAKSEHDTVARVIGGRRKGQEVDCRKGQECGACVGGERRCLAEVELV